MFSKKTDQRKTESGLFGRWQQRRAALQKARLIYRKMMTQARLSFFYESCGVPDTIDGRFEIVILHAALLTERLSTEKTDQADQVAQAVFDVMFRDMQQALRNIGVGDLAVPHHIKRMMKGFQGRAMAYRTSEGDLEATQEVLKRNLFATAETADPAHIGWFVAYMDKTRAALRNAQAEHVIDAVFDWPVPERDI